MRKIRNDENYTDKTANKHYTTPKSMEKLNQKAENTKIRNKENNTDKTANKRSTTPKSKEITKQKSFIGYDLCRNQMIPGVIVRKVLRSWLGILIY